jgi:hypothetical protein
MTTQRSIEVLEFQIKIEITARETSDSSFYISRPLAHGKDWYVMHRTHDLGGANYGYFYPMSFEEAKSIVRQGFLTPWFTNADLFV